MENNQENIPPVIQPQPPKIINKNWFLNRKFLWPVFGIVIIVGAFFYFNVVKNPCFSENYLGTELGPECADSLIPENLPSQSNETLTWETYTNDQYGFEFKYPHGWSLTDLYNNLLLKNIDGEQIIQIAFSLRNVNSDYQKTLENYIKSTAGQENSRSGEDMPENIEKVFFEKIIDDNEILGYISQWKIVWKDKTSETETRADFESKLEINQTGNYKTVLSFFALKTEKNFNSIDLLKSIASTFKFIKLEPVDVKVSNLKPNSFEWCMANGGEDRTPNYNAPKVCILENKVYEESCVSNNNYFVIEGGLTDSVGANHLVKYKTNENQSFDCKYVIAKDDFEIKNEWAEYTLALENNFLILDSGTGPDPRGLIIYNLITRKKVYTDEYFEPLLIQNNTIDYWSPTGQKATNENCSKLNEYLSGGLGAGIDSHVILDLLTLSKKELGEYRCSPRQ